MLEKTNPELAFLKTVKTPNWPSKGLMAATFLELGALKKASLPLVKTCGLLGGLNQIHFGPKHFLCGPFLGAPMAVMGLENLHRHGVSQIIFVGLCGGLIYNSQNIGDLFIPSQGLSTEGTSAHYPAPLTPNLKLFESLTKAFPEAQKGPVWSTDAPFRETSELVEKEKNLGAQVVDMECAALMAAANFRALKFAAILIISDIISPKGHKEGFKNQKLKASLNNLAQKIWPLINDN